jgi:hypothetical protein
MNYQIVKELKEAGFPHDWSQFDDHDQELLQKTWDMYGKGYSPTLSKLINVLGQRFYSLEQISPNMWRAQSFAIDEHTDDRTRWIGARTHGVSPEIAAARLWLAVYANTGAIA